MFKSKIVRANRTTGSMINSEDKNCTSKFVDVEDDAVGMVVKVPERNVEAILLGDCREASGH